MEKSVEHVWTKQHHREWDSISIHDQARNKRFLLVKEALHISSAGQHTLLNRDQGTAISDCWRLPLRCTACQSRLDLTSQICPYTWTRNFHLWTLDLHVAINNIQTCSEVVVSVYSDEGYRNIVAETSAFSIKFFGWNREYYHVCDWVCSHKTTVALLWSM